MANECVPFYEPGGRLTAKADAALAGKRFVDISNNRESGPGLSATAEGSNYRVNYPSAGARALGVTDRDVASGAKVTIICDPGTVVPVLANGTIDANDEVEVDGSGRVVTLASGIPVGKCMTGVTSGNDAEIKLY